MARAQARHNHARWIIRAASAASSMPLSPLFDNYDHVLLDLDGCVWVDQTPTPNAREALAELRNHGKTLAFVTNDSAPGARGVRPQAVVDGAAGVAGGGRHRRRRDPVRARRPPPGHADLRHRLGGDLPPRRRRRPAHRQRHRPRRPARRSWWWPATTTSLSRSCAPPPRPCSTAPR